MINNKFIHFLTYDTFDHMKLSVNPKNTEYKIGFYGEDVFEGEPDIPYDSIVFIKDTRCIFTHGQIYDCGSSGVLSGSDVKNLGDLIRGVSDISAPRTDPFKRIDFSDLRGFKETIDTLVKAGESYEKNFGVFRGLVGGVDYILYSFLTDDDKSTQILIGSFSGNNDLQFNSNLGILRRSFDGASWSSWETYTTSSDLLEIKSKQSELKAQVDNFYGRLQGTSSDTNPRRDPFKWLGTFSDLGELSEALSGMVLGDGTEGRENLGVFRGFDTGRDFILFASATSYEKRYSTQTLIGPFDVDTAGSLTRVTKNNILCRNYDGTVWSPWVNVCFDSSALLPSRWGGKNDNVDDCLETGIYPWCSQGRLPEGITGHLTLLVEKSTTTDFSGFNTFVQTAFGREFPDEGRVFKRILFKKGNEGTQYGNWIEISPTHKMMFEGIVRGDVEGIDWVNSQKSRLSIGQQFWFVVANSAGSISGGTVTFTQDLASLLHPEDSRGVAANLGDILVLSRINETEYKAFILPLNDAKSPALDFPGTYGILTPNDRMDIDNSFLTSRGETNIDLALETGVYPWCDLGRPAGSKGHFTCITQKSRNADSNGFFTVVQNIYGREKDEEGLHYARVIFINEKDNIKEYNSWCRSNWCPSKDVFGGSANECLESGVYPWIDVDVPTTDSHYTILVTRTTTPDTNGFYTVEQTAYSREPVGKIYKRIIFDKPGNQQIHDWISLTSGGEEGLYEVPEILFWTNAEFKEESSGGGSLDSYIEEEFDAEFWTNLYNAVKEGRRLVTKFTFFFNNLFPTPGKTYDIINYCPVDATVTVLEGFQLPGISMRVERWGYFDNDRIYSEGYGAPEVREIIVCLKENLDEGSYHFERVYRREYNAVRQVYVIDNLTNSIGSTNALSAKQGYVLNNKITELQNKITNLTGFEVSVVASLPGTGENNILYLIKNEDNDEYTEYIWIGSERKFEKLGEAFKLIVDDSLDPDSTNPIQNRVVKEELDKKQPLGDYALSSEVAKLVSSIPSVVNNLESTSTSSALSASMGKSLKESIDSLNIPTVENTLDSTSTVNALSAAKGKELSEKIGGYKITSDLISNFLGLTESNITDYIDLGKLKKAVESGLPVFISGNASNYQMEIPVSAMIRNGICCLGFTTYNNILVNQEAPLICYQYQLIIFYTGDNVNKVFTKKSEGSVVSVSNDLGGDGSLALSVSAGKTLGDRVTALENREVTIKMTNVYPYNHFEVEESDPITDSKTIVDMFDGMTYTDLIRLVEGQERFTCMVEPQNPGRNGFSNSPSRTLRIPAIITYGSAEGSNFDHIIISLAPMYSDSLKKVVSYVLRFWGEGTVFTKFYCDQY